MKNEDLAADGNFIANLILSRQTEEELAQVEDNIFALIVFVYLIGWVMCLYCNFTFLSYVPHYIT